MADTKPACALTPLLHILNGILPFNLVKGNADDTNCMFDLTCWIGVIITVIFFIIIWILHHISAFAAIDTAEVNGILASAYVLVMHQWGKPDDAKTALGAH